MSVEIRPTSSHRSRNPVFDVHAHAWKQPGVIMKLADRYSTPERPFIVYGDGSLAQALSSMAEVGIRRRIIKNLAVSPRGVPAANDFALDIARNCPELIPTGTVHAEYPENEREVERLAAGGVRGIAFDSCWQGFHINDPRLREVYRKISHQQMFILTHTGIDPEADYNECLTWPAEVMAVKELSPDSVVIAAHLGANKEFYRAREYSRDAGILFDLAWVMEHLQYLRSCQPQEIIDLIYFLGIDRIVYGSDYPWSDPGAAISFWENVLPAEVWRKISHENILMNPGLPPSVLGPWPA